MIYLEKGFSPAAEKLTHFLEENHLALNYPSKNSFCFYLYHGNPSLKTGHNIFLPSAF